MCPYHDGPVFCGGRFRRPGDASVPKAVPARRILANKTVKRHYRSNGRIPQETLCAGQGGPFSPYGAIRQARPQSGICKKQRPAPALSHGEKETRRELSSGVKDLKAAWYQAAGHSSRTWRIRGAHIRKCRSETRPRRRNHGREARPRVQASTPPVRWSTCPGGAR